MRTYAQLVEGNANLRALVAAQQATIAELRKVVELQAARIKELETEVMRLKRRGKRQAAPFSKGSPKSKSQKPGRKRGKKYGRVSERSVPKQADTTIRVGCPLFCAHCEGQVRLEEKRCNGPQKLDHG